jgi:hypothetical protein
MVCLTYRRDVVPKRDFGVAQPPDVEMLMDAGVISRSICQQDRLDPGNQAEVPERRI